MYNLERNFYVNNPDIKSESYISKGPTKRRFKSELFYLHSFFFACNLSNSKDLILK